MGGPPSGDPGATVQSASVDAATLDRVGRMVGLALDCQVSVGVDTRGAAPRADIGISVRASHGVAHPLFRGGADERVLPADAAEWGVAAASFAILPLLDRTASSAHDEAPGDAPALYVISELPRAWSHDERSALLDIAASLGAELTARRALAECRAASEALRRDALHDRVTGLPNRVLLLDRLGHAVERGRRHKEFRFAVMSLDLDRFQSINDSLGVGIGDDVLVAVARRLEECVRGEDLVARLGGDEFAILLESLGDDADAGRVAERILRSLMTPVGTAEGDVFVTATIGITLSSSGIDAAADAPVRLLQRAGVAMSRAKVAGRARYEMFDKAMHARAVARLRMETELRHAIDRNEFLLYYQPMISLGTGRVTEVEALLRWRHPVRGIVPPLDFLPLAEETGLIVPIGQWVLAEACRQTREMQHRLERDEPLSLSVNLSVRQLEEPDFVEFVAETIAASGLDPRCLKLEVTESIGIEDPERARRALEELRALGLRIYLDDFGTGYSSLGQLHRLPLDAIKIDRSFVAPMGEGQMHLQLVRTVRDLARNIGVAVVAEGVETVAQLEVLRGLGCEAAQGYLFSRPVPADEIERLLVSNPQW